MSDLDILGIGRMVNRAFEQATVLDKTAIHKWHKAEFDAAKRKANEETALAFGYKHAARKGD